MTWTRAYRRIVIMTNTWRDATVSVAATTPPFLRSFTVFSSAAGARFRLPPPPPLERRRTHVGVPALRRSSRHVCELEVVYTKIRNLGMPVRRIRVYGGVLDYSSIAFHSSSLSIRCVVYNNDQRYLLCVFYRALKRCLRLSIPSLCS